MKNNTEDTIQKVATAINVQLNLETDQPIPFVPFNHFEAAILADKLFFYGPSGSGKSRIIVEIIRQRISKIERIYVLNPRNPAGKNASRDTLTNLIARFEPGDVVIWDNFPDDLFKRDFASAQKVLEILTSKNVLFLIALKPSYLEVFRNVANQIPDLYPVPVVYDRRRIKEILRAYGTRLTRFQPFYHYSVKNEIDKISSLLWQKEPLPITVLNYYEDLEMSSKNNPMQKPEELSDQIKQLDVAEEAIKLLARTNFYEYQFMLIKSDPTRRSDTDFLYSLKLCYELGRDRRPDVVEEFQRNILKSSPHSDPIQRLSMWVYLSDTHYSMHDSCREAIKFGEASRLRIVTSIVENFSNLVSSSTDNNQVYLLGQFIGKNVHLLPDNKTRVFLPVEIYDFAKSNRYFEEGLGHGIGEVFPTLDDALQETILRRVEIDIQFAQALGDSLGLNFQNLFGDYKRSILNKVAKSIIFARYFGQSMGRVIFHLPKEVQEEIFAEVKRNPQFSGVGIGLGYVFKFLNDEMRVEAMKRSSTDPDLRRGLGCGFAQHYLSLQKELNAELDEQIDRDDKFAQGFGLGIGHLFSHLSRELQMQAILWAHNNEHFAYGCGTGIGYRFNYLDKEIQREILLKRIFENDEFAQGLGLGAGVIFAYFSKDVQEEILKSAQRNPRLMTGLGCGHGLKFVYMPAEVQIEVFARAEKDLLFADGLGWGLGYTWVYLNESSRAEVFTRIKNNPGLAKGFGWGLGRIFDYSLSAGNYKIEKLSDILIHDNQQFALGFGLGIGISASKSIERNKASFSNTYFEYGLGYGVAQKFPYSENEFRTFIINRMQDNADFSDGLGIGLGQIFHTLNEAFKEEIISLMINQTNDTFSHGLGIGIGHNFRYLDDIAQERILDWATKNIEFSKGLAPVLGRNFPSFIGRTRDYIMKTIRSDTAFAAFFGSNFDHARRYISNEMPDDLLATIVAPEDKTMSKSLRDQNIMHTPQIKISATEDFPSTGLVKNNKVVAPLSSLTGSNEVSFSGNLERYCVCFIDIIDSTNITAGLSERDVGRYYGLFLNSMASIIKNFGGQIIKNAGDGLIFYFPQTSEPSKETAFKDVLECLITMVDAHRDINAKLLIDNLPPLNYRISADYGRLERVKSASSQSDDLFGSTMNICAKINAKAKRNGIVLGDNLYNAIARFSIAKLYSFRPAGVYSILGKSYQIHEAQSAHERSILNPFSRVSELLSYRLKEDLAKPDDGDSSHFYRGTTNNLQIHDIEHNSSGAKKSSFRILLIDDEEDALYTYKLFLESEGYTVDAFPSARAALDRFQKVNSNYDIVITDIRMPEINGIQLYNLFMAINRDTKILFISALDSANEMLTLLHNVGPNQLIRKPVDKNNLIRKIKLLLEQ